MSNSYGMEKKMNGILSKLAMALLVLIVSGMFLVNSAFATVICSDMKIVKAGAKVIGGAKVNVVRVMIGSGSCGNMTTTEARTFNFSDANADSGLATALTALSLGQNIYLVLTDDNAAVGTTVETIQVAAP